MTDSQDETVSHRSQSCRAGKECGHYEAWRLCAKFSTPVHGMACGRQSAPQSMQPSGYRPHMMRKPSQQLTPHSSVPKHAHLSSCRASAEQLPPGALQGTHGTVLLCACPFLQHLSPVFGDAGHSGTLGSADLPQLGPSSNSHAERLNSPEHNRPGQLEYALPFLQAITAIANAFLVALGILAFTRECPYPL